MRTIISSVVAICGLFLLVPHCNAYFVTHTSATKINDTTALYTLTYQFGLYDYDIYMPILSQRDLPFKDDATDTVGYSLRSYGKDITEEGAATSFVFPDSPNITIVNNMYKIPKNTAAQMTLFVVLQTATDTPEDNYALRVDKLPFIVDLTSKMQTRNMFPSELQYYTTDAIKLNGA